MINPFIQHFSSRHFEEALSNQHKAISETTGTYAMSFEEFLARPHSDWPVEWVNGQVFRMAETNALHHVTVDFIKDVLESFVNAQNLGAIYSAPFQVRLLRSSRCPDLSFITTARLDAVKDTYILGGPDVVVEVLSPFSAAQDRGEKFFEYEQAQIREYWLIDPQRQWAEFYTLNRLGRYQPSVVGDAGVFRSRTLRQFWLRLEWLWERPQPQAILREMGISRLSMP